MIVETHARCMLLSGCSVLGDKYIMHALSILSTSNYYRSKLMPNFYALVCSLDDLYRSGNAACALTSVPAVNSFLKISAPSLPIVPIGSLNEVGVHEVGLHEVGLHELGLHEVGMNEAGLHELGLHEVGLNKVWARCDPKHWEESAT